MFAKIFFWFYNFLYLIISIWLLLFANTYFNDLIIPDKFKWDGNKLKEDMTIYASMQLIILVIEIVLLVLLIHFFNKKYLSGVIKTENLITANWASGLVSMCLLCFVAFLIYGAYNS